MDEVKRIKALANAAVIKEDTGSYVFIRIYGYVLDAMEDLLWCWRSPTASWRLKGG